jgi:chromosome segregation ATPase
MLYYKDCDFDLGIKKILLSFQEEPDVEKYTEILVDWTKKQLEDLDNVLGEILDAKDGLVITIEEHQNLIYDIREDVKENQKKLEKLDIKSDNVKEQIDDIVSQNETVIDNIESFDDCFLFYGDEIAKSIKTIREDLGGLLN